MKKVVYLFAMLCACFMVSCGGKKHDSKAEERQIYQIGSVDENTGVQRMQESHIDIPFVCRGQSYKLMVDRKPDSSMPVVKSDMGTFYDNRIDVKILHENGKSLFSKSFTKNDFSAHLTPEYLSRSVLEGVVFDDVKTAENKEITLAASVSYPMTDLYVPFTLVVSQSGKLILARDEDMGELTPIEEAEEN